MLAQIDPAESKIGCGEYNSAFEGPFPEVTYGMAADSVSDAICCTIAIAGRDSPVDTWAVRGTAGSDHVPQPLSG